MSIARRRTARQTHEKKRSEREKYLFQIVFAILSP